MALEDYIIRYSTVLHIDLRRDIIRVLKERYKNTIIIKKHIYSWY